MRLPILSLLLLLSLYATAQRHCDADSAYSEAQAMHRPILLVFSGSDWCPNCMRFERKILSDSTFMSYAQQGLTILMAEFPQRKKLSPHTIAQNKRLADKYNTDGYFPHILLIEEGDKKAISIDYANPPVADFIRTLDEARANLGYHD